MIGVPGMFAKRLVCRAGLHAMTEKNYRIETIKRNGYSYKVRRCKACQARRCKAYYDKRKGRKP